MDSRPDPTVAGALRRGRALLQGGHVGGDGGRGRWPTAGRAVEGALHRRWHAAACGLQRLYTQSSDDSQLLRMSR